MKLVFSQSEVAAALGLDESVFQSRLPHLLAQNFPSPIPGLEDRWSIMDVMSWVNRSNTHPAQQSTLSTPSTSRH